MKPSSDEVRSRVDKCPGCRRPGWAVWYLPEDLNDRSRLQLVVHHGLGPHKGWRRNQFHYFDVFRKSQDNEIKMSYRANPDSPPSTYGPAYDFLYGSRSA